jgi:D-alanine transaminase
MKTLAYYNGKIGEFDEVTVPFNDRSHWFGDGVYDATCAANHTIFALDEHIDRFFRSAEKTRIELGIDKPALRALLTELCKKVDSPNQFVYWQATRGGMTQRRHAFPRASASAAPAAYIANLWVMIGPGEIGDMNKKVKLVAVEDTRFLLCDAKTINLLPNVLASEQAEEAGCEEAVFHRNGRVTECSHGNISILKDGVFRTAPADSLILPGIARAHLLRYCEELGIPADETAFTLDDLFMADEAIVTSASNFCLSVCEVDGKPVGGRAPELLKRLQGAAAAHFTRETGQII